MTMRIIFSFFLISMGIYLMFGNSSRHLAIRRLMFLGFVLMGISTLLFSESWTKFSNFLGVGSSTQLLTYLVTFAFITSTVSNYRWRRENERRLVEISRKIALELD